MNERLSSLAKFRPRTIAIASNSAIEWGKKTYSTKEAKTKPLRVLSYHP